MRTHKISKNQAKQYMVNYHNINTATSYSGLPGIKEFFTKVGSIQYDPLNVVGRNSDLVLQSRFKDYKASLLDDALYKDRILIDGWDKMMGIYQTIDFPYFKSIRDHRAESQIDTLRHRLSIEALDYCDDVISLIQESGPLFSSEIKLGETKKHRWGHTKPSSATLDYLFHKGQLGIREKRNTQKQYDLIGNLVENNILTKEVFKSDDEFIEWYLLRRIKSIGLVWNKNSVAWSGRFISKKGTRNKYLEKLFSAGLIDKVYIEGIKDLFYVPSTNSLNDIQCKKAVSFIAPLDNIIWDRDLVSKVFDFDYRWEVYTPIKKRKYGYYVLPVLYGSDFIGRIEFAQHRNSDPLEVKNIWFEEWFTADKEYIDAYEAAIKKFKNYLGAK